MINLRIQEIAEAQGLSLDQLSQRSNVSLQDIQSYENIQTLTDDIAKKLREIASNLNVSVVELVKPVVKKRGLRFKIFELIQKKNLTIEKLSELSEVHPAIIAFYSTQPIDEHKFNELESKNEYLTKLSKAIGCSNEELKVEADLPITKLDLKEWAEKRGLNLKDISVLTNLPIDFIDLIATQYLDKPLDVSSEENLSQGFLGLIANNSDILSVIPETTPKEVLCKWIKIITGEETWICK
jgi:hypothetical protein